MGERFERYKAKAALTPPVPFQWYAEDTTNTINDHNAHCSDPACTNDIELRIRDKRLVVMVQNHEPKKLFIAEYGTNTAHDYEPLDVFNLETGEEVAGAFHEDGATQRTFTGHINTNIPVCLGLLCHNKGVALRLHKDAPDTVSLVCAEPTCQRPLKMEKVLTWKMKLAKQPVNEYPKMFCNYHGVQFGYSVCRHVAHGEEPMILNRPTDEYFGDALCSDKCWERNLQEAEDYSKGKEVKSSTHYMCAKDLNEMYGGKLEQLHQRAEAPEEVAGR